MNLKKKWKVLTSKFVGTGPSSYKKRIYRPAVSQSLRNTALHHYECAGRTYVTPAPSFPSTTGSAVRLWSRRLACNRILENRLLLSENAELGIRDRHICDDVKPGEGRPRPPNLTHHDLPLGPRSHIPKVSVNCGETRIQTRYYRTLRRGFHHTAPMGRQLAARCFRVGATPRERLPFYWHFATTRLPDIVNITYGQHFVGTTPNGTFHKTRTAQRVRYVLPVYLCVNRFLHHSMEISPNE